MNENLNLVEILKDCPSGTKLYSPALGEVDFVDILEDCTYNIRVKGECGTFHFTPQGKLFNTEQGECILFPSKDQRDWSKFTAPWYRKEMDTIARIEKQGKQEKQVHFPKFTFDDVLALQCCMETVKKVQEDEELYEKLNIIHSKIYDAYWIEK